MRIDLSLLLLATPMTPPVTPPAMLEPNPPDAVVPSGREVPPAGGAVGVAPGREAVAEPLPGVVPWPCASGTKSSFVIGSLYFLRRNFSRTRTSRFGGYALAYF